MMPLGIRCNAVFTPLMTSVWPALWPPWKRTTPWALSVSQSTSLPLPSSPHWVPTTTTFLPVVTLMLVPLLQKFRSLGHSTGRPARRARGRNGIHRFRCRVPAARRQPFHRPCAVGRWPGAGRPRRSRARGWRRAAGAWRQHADQLAHVEAEADGRTVAAEHGAHLVVAAAAHQRIGGARHVDAEAHAAVVGVAAQVGQVEADFAAGRAVQARGQLQVRSASAAPTAGVPFRALAASSSTDASPYSWTSARSPSREAAGNPW
jgi:hypothetical protein